MYTIKVSDSVYRYCQAYRDPMTGAKKTVSVTRSDTRKKTQKEAAKALQDKISQRGQTLRMGQISKIVDNYFCYQKSHVREQTAITNNRHLRGLLRLIGPDVVAENITAPYIQHILDAADIPATRKNEYMTRFKALWRWAYRYGYVSSTAPVDALAPYPTDETRSKRAEKYLETDELHKLLTGMTVPHWQILSRFLVLSGLRIGEALALIWDDIGDEYITVDKTWSETVRRVCPMPKTEASCRSVYMQAELRQLVLGLDHSASGPFCGWSYQAYAKYLRETSERLLGRRLTPHSLRHTHASILAADGVQYDVIARRLGHTDSRVTRDIYIHVTSQMQKNDAAVIAGTAPVF